MRKQIFATKSDFNCNNYLSVYVLRVHVLVYGYIRRHMSTYVRLRCPAGSYFFAQSLFLNDLLGKQNKTKSSLAVILWRQKQQQQTATS